MTDTLELVLPANANRAAIVRAWARHRGIELRAIGPAELPGWRERQRDTEREYPRTCHVGHTINGQEDEYRKPTRTGSDTFWRSCAECARESKRRRKQQRKAAA